MLSLAGPDWPATLPPAQVWLVEPDLAAAAQDALQRAAGVRPRLVIDGWREPGSPPGAALVDGGPASATGVQRALQLGAPVVVLATPARGAAVTGAAAWYHSWRLETDRTRMAGALVAGLASQAAAPGASGVTELEVDAGGNAFLSPVERMEALPRLLLEPGVGPALPETAVDLATVHLREGGDRRLRVTGTRSDGGRGAPAGAFVEWRGARHPLGPIPPARGSHAPLDLEERTVSFPRAGQDGVELRARDVLRAWAVDHGDHSVLALVPHRSDDFASVEDWASPLRASHWFGTELHVSRQVLPNLSAVRLVCADRGRHRAQQVVDRTLSSMFTG